MSFVQCKGLSTPRTITIIIMIVLKMVPTQVDAGVHTATVTVITGVDEIVGITFRAI